MPDCITHKHDVGLMMPGLWISGDSRQILVIDVDDEGTSLCNQDCRTFGQ